MADPLYDRVILQLRAKSGFTGLMNQARMFDDAFVVGEDRISDEHGFLNDHSFKLDKTANLFTSFSTFFYRNLATQMNMTFECRIRFNTLTENAFICQLNSSTASNSRVFGVSSAGKMVYYSNTSANATQTGSAVITTNTDYHLAFVRTYNGTTIGGKLLMFLDGVKVFDASNTTYTKKTVSDTTSYIILGGSRWQANNRVDGYIDDVRITLYDRYRENFTPPTNDDFTEPDTPNWYIERPSREGKTRLPTDNINWQAAPSKSTYFIPTYTKKLDISNPTIGTDIQLPSTQIIVSSQEKYEYRNVYGQHNIEATVLIDNEPVPNTHVHLMLRSNKKIIRSTISDEYGNYSFKNVPANTDFVIYAEDSIAKPTNLRKNAYVRDFVRLASKQVCIVGNRNIQNIEKFTLKAYGLTEPTTFTFKPTANITYSVASITLTPETNTEEFSIMASEPGVYTLDVNETNGFEVVAKTIVNQGSGVIDPVMIGYPHIDGGIYVGDTLTVTPAVLFSIPTATMSYQWLRDGLPIAGQTSLTYTLTQDDPNHQISVEQTATVNGNDYIRSSNKVNPFTDITQHVKSLYTKYGAVGGMYDMLDKSTLYSDSNGLTPIADVGNDPVLFVMDISGNNLHLHQNNINNAVLSTEAGLTNNSSTDLFLEFSDKIIPVSQQDVESTTYDGFTIAYSGTNNGGAWMFLFFLYQTQSFVPYFGIRGSGSGGFETNFKSSSKSDGNSTIFVNTGSIDPELVGQRISCVGKLRKIGAISIETINKVATNPLYSKSIYLPTNFDSARLFEGGYNITCSRLMFINCEMSDEDNNLVKQWIDGSP